MPANISVKIKDTITNEIFDINGSPFEVYLEPGFYNDRFKLVFTQLETKDITIENIENLSSVSIRYNSKLSELSLLNTDNINIKDLALYDILGNEIKSLKLNTNSNISIPVSAITGLYIVKLNTEKGIATKKIIIE